MRFRRTHLFFSVGIISTSIVPQDGCAVLYSERQGSSWDTCQKEDLYMCCCDTGKFTFSSIHKCNHILMTVSHKINNAESCVKHSTFCIFLSSDCTLSPAVHIICTQIQKRLVCPFHDMEKVFYLV
jgi:hypothetical protein